MRYLVGDLQGCCSAFERLLQKIDFSPSRDHLVALGDLINRGPESLATLERLRGLGDSASCLLGNHDLNFLAVAYGVRKPGRGDTIEEILQSPELDAWIEWLRSRRLALHEDGWLLVHAGVPPQWDVATTLALAGEVESHLRSDDLHDFLSVMYGNAPARWDDALTGDDRLRFAVNALTRMRFVDADGTLELKTTGAPAAHPPEQIAWFDAPNRKTRDQPIAFGHWSALGLLDRPDVLALDTGCVWGGQLTAARIDDGRRELIQVQCEASQKPG
jgi:bis(5'-nucleosyl)-tetraphosphatase (symmetrical)